MTTETQITAPNGDPNPKGPICPARFGAAAALLHDAKSPSLSPRSALAYLMGAIAVHAGSESGIADPGFDVHLLHPSQFKFASAGGATRGFETAAEAAEFMLGLMIGERDGVGKPEIVHDPDCTSLWCIMDGSVRLDSWAHRSLACARLDGLYAAV